MSAWNTEKSVRQILQRPRHNHWMRDVKPLGQCPACDQTLLAYANAMEEGR